MHNLKLIGTVFLSIVLCDVYASDTEPLLFEEGVFYRVPLDPVTRQTLLHKAILKGSLEECKGLLDLKADPNARNSQEITPLTQVSISIALKDFYKCRVAQALISAGAVVTQQDIECARRSTDTYLFADFLNKEYHKQHLHTYGWCKRKYIECFVL